MNPSSLEFLSEPISNTQYSSPPTQIKKPPCPVSFTWRGEEFIVIACLAEWKDFSRRGRMRQNMQPKHIPTASQRGSWGVGRFYFDVKTDNNRFFRIYYDRAPSDSNDRTGSWFILAELFPSKV